jgi:hypothetical protein
MYNKRQVTLFQTIVALKQILNITEFMLDYAWEYLVESFSSYYEIYNFCLCVCLRHPILTGKSRSRRPSEHEILEKSRSPPHSGFLKSKES